MLPLLPFVVSIGVEAIACGGFFCSQTPVMQTGEKIIFAVDEEANTVDVIIEIQYAGAAENFAWVLPLLSAPTHMGVGTTRLFSQIDNATAPQFTTQTIYGPKCTVFPPSQGGSDASAPGGGMDAGAGPVVVLAREQVGPYDSAVIQSTDPQAIRDWLEEAGYDVTDQMMESVRPYVLKGDALLALKLLKNETVGALQPFAVRLSSTEPCIPLRMTSIAASSDMAVTALVLSNKGRAIPANYLHVEPNFARIRWPLDAFASYRELIADAANEAGGNAFTTEYAGTASVLEGQIFRPGEYDLARLRATTDLAAFFVAASDQGLNRRSELVGILRKYVTDMVLAEVEVVPDDFWRCPNCYYDQLSRIMFDPNPAVDDIEERIVTPDRDAQGLFDRFPDLTRLYTLISPEEMSVDPIFEFRELPPVSNRHVATVTYECGNDGQISNARVKVELENGTSYYTTPTGQPDVGPQPAALKIENLKDGTVVVDNTQRVEEMNNRSIKDNVRDSSCTCDATSRDGAFGVFALFALAAIVSRSRRR